MHARPIRSSLGPDPNGSAPVCTGPKSYSSIIFTTNELTLHNITFLELFILPMGTISFDLDDATFHMGSHKLHSYYDVTY